ncbi:PhoU domain-containing protein [Gracilibacillus alcaliphilus]|uniref:PhoU domain-containing protein n=1 Tax=Gracilibacillus alcaliphilus TaxID=1401441 RepID=UPI00195EAF54|nr:phosphate uptake regulator PhoU [Gracilibacillus alcaliphilus]MBM7679028.1 phosphate uptake regulator [Gracilibacillus alcaliphilus]
MLVRRNYHDQRRKQIKEEVLEILANINQMMQMFDNFLLHPTAENKNIILENEDFIDKHEKKTEKYIIEIISLEQLDTTEIKWLFSMGRIIRELERAGDQLANIVTISDMIDTVEFRPLVREFFHYEQEMINWLIIGINDDKEDKLEAVIHHDEHVNELNKETYQHMAKLIKKKANFTENQLKMVIISRFLERMGDHLVNAARAYKETVFFYNGAGTKK